MKFEDGPLATSVAAGHSGGQADPGGYRVFGRNLVVAVSIGIHAHEKRQRARLRVNADLEVGLKLPTHDDFSEVLNYEGIVGGIKALAEAKQHINLVETFADRIVTLCLGDPRVRGVRVSVEKLDIYPEADSVGVLIERRRA